ncbi:MAG: 16S rRNA (adenine(1518)-N(6)/adenine(1519)-N(6))-dimethyltransferase RsmA [Eggerthellaceae bacterium]|nr:16S rRNA (adenine(1518)-N(6)/adenine(1519)-N(6))-dimethyltransferase RsmA [Eggerthellaceae bacterium]
MEKHSFLTSVRATQLVLDKYGLETKKALGQHFLISDGVLGRICELADLSEGDVVLEVGPGIGTLTLALLKQAGSVISVERDSDLVAPLLDVCAGHEDDFTLLNMDALELELEDFESPTRKLPNKLVSNLPFSVAATLLLAYFERFPSLESATVMVQREVADRMCATLGSKAYGAYTVKLALYAAHVGHFNVGPKNFYPPPQVKSCVLRFDRRQLLDASGNPLSPEAIANASLMADAAFATRRKTILNSCKTYFAALGEVEEWSRAVELLPEVFELAGIDPMLRGEALEPESFVRLGDALAKLRD